MNGQVARVGEYDRGSAFVTLVTDILRSFIPSAICYDPIGSFNSLDPLRKLAHQIVPIPATLKTELNPTSRA